MFFGRTKKKKLRIIEVGVDGALLAINETTSSSVGLCPNREGGICLQYIAWEPN